MHIQPYISLYIPIYPYRLAWVRTFICFLGFLPGRAWPLGQPAAQVHARRVGPHTPEQLLQNGPAAQSTPAGSPPQARAAQSAPTGSAPTGQSRFGRKSPPHILHPRGRSPQARAESLRARHVLCKQTRGSTLFSPKTCGGQSI